MRDHHCNHGLGPHSLYFLLQQPIPPSVLSSVEILHHHPHDHLQHHQHHHHHPHQHHHPDHHHHGEKTSRRLDTMSISVNLPSSQLIMKHWLAKPHFIIIAVVIIAIVIISIIIIVGVKVITNVLIFLLKVIDLIYIYIH